MDILNNNTNKTVQKQKVVTDEEVDNLFKSSVLKPQKKVCMVLGEDGTGKSGLVLNHIIQEIKEKGGKALIFDLDRGVNPLLKFYDKEIKKDIIIIDPIEKGLKVNDEGETYIDYKKVMELIKRVLFKLIDDKEREKLGINYLVFDGLSKFLEVCENQMRLDINKTNTDGIPQLYWKKRKDYFFKIMDLIKMIPIDSYIIGHTNLILEQNQSAIPVALNAMVFQRIICKDVRENNEIKLIANINKSKYNPLKENKDYTFMKANNDKVVFNSKKVFEGL